MSIIHMRIPKTTAAADITVYYVPNTVIRMGMYVKLKIMIHDKMFTVKLVDKKW